jgi:hypothetical protein
MIGLKKATGVLVCGLASLAIVGLLSASASAGPLVGTGLSYKDSVKPAGWEGTGTFTKNSVPPGTRLYGTVEWAVFTGANFSSLFPSSGYTPTPGELVYTYQIYNDATSVEISKTMTLLLSGAPADNEAYFTSNGMSGVLPSSMQIIPADVVWNYSSPNIAPSQHSCGLVFCSNRTPRSDLQAQVDGGLVANAPVGGPGTTTIPEPSALALLSVAMASLGIYAVGKRGKGKA